MLRLLAGRSRLPARLRGARSGPASGLRLPRRARGGGRAGQCAAAGGGSAEASAARAPLPLPLPLPAPAGRCLRAWRARGGGWGRAGRARGGGREARAGRSGSGSGSGRPGGRQTGLKYPGAVPLLPPRPAPRARPPRPAPGTGGGRRGRAQSPARPSREDLEAKERLYPARKRRGSVRGARGCAAGLEPEPRSETWGESLRPLGVFPHEADAEAPDAFRRECCGAVNKGEAREEPRAGPHLRGSAAPGRVLDTLQPLRSDFPRRGICEFT